jgi:hypothetical protein
MMEAARTSETLVNFYQTTRCYNPEDSNLLFLSPLLIAGNMDPSKAYRTEGRTAKLFVTRLSFKFNGKKKN